MAKVTASFDDKRLKRNLRHFDKNFANAASAVVDRQAAVATAYVKTNAPWTDRTSAARTGLSVTANTSSSYGELFFAYSVSYGIWLEIANDRKYAIITPAMRIMGNELLINLTGLLNRINYDA